MHQTRQAISVKMGTLNAIYTNMIDMDRRSKLQRGEGLLEEMQIVDQLAHQTTQSRLLSESMADTIKADKTKARFRDCESPNERLMAMGFAYMGHPELKSRADGCRETMIELKEDYEVNSN